MDEEAIYKNLERKMRLRTDRLDLFKSQIETLETIFQGGLGPWDGIELPNGKELVYCSVNKRLCIDGSPLIQWKMEMREFVAAHWTMILHSIDASIK